MKILLFAAVCCIVIPIYGQEKSPKETPNTQRSAAQQPSPAPFPTTAQGRPVNENAFQQQGYAGSGETKGYFSRLISPESLPNLILCFIGAAGVMAAVYTLGKMEAQVEEMRAQSNQVKESVALAKDTAERQLRAYVCIASGLVKFRHPGIPEAQVDFANYGQTPAYDVHSWIHMWIESHPLRIVLPEPPRGFEMSTAVLPPGGQPHSLAIDKKPPVQEDARGLLCTSQGTIYIYGMIRYRDAFGKERTTRYRLICGGSQGGKSETASDGTVTARLQPDIEGNEAT